MDPGHASIEADFTTTAELLECLGCSRSRFRELFFSDFHDEPEVTLFPPATYRPRPPWVSELPLDIRKLIHEVYVALGSDSRTLASIGLRTLIDIVVYDRLKKDYRTFAKKLDALYKHDLITAGGKDILKALIKVGNAAAHQGHRPSPAELVHATEIVENLLQSIYVLDSKKVGQPPP